jgi:hypothetical protein
MLDQVATSLSVKLVNETGTSSVTPQYRLVGTILLHVCCTNVNESFVCTGIVHWYSLTKVTTYHLLPHIPFFKNRSHIRSSRS